VSHEPVARRRFQFLLLLIGVSLLVLLFWQVGWPAVAANLARIGWWFAAIVALYALPQGAFVAGWREVLAPRPSPAFLPNLAGAYLAGDTLNYIGAGVAGEPVRALLLRPDYAGVGAFASINLRKQADLVGQVAFLFPGLVIGLSAFRLPGLLAAAAVAGALVVGAGLALMTWALRRGSYSPILGRISRFKPLAKRLARYREGAADVDEEIRRFHAEQPRRFAASAALSFLGWCGGFVETWLILKLLGVPAGWGAALAIETLTMTLNTLLLFVPGRLGSAEAVRTGVFVALGLPAAAGVAYALVRRAREIVWALPGALVLVKRHALSLLSPGTPEEPTLTTRETSG
jgi:uncharacterized membrane protein YbhN (UPF0104 family)